MIGSDFGFALQKVRAKDALHQPETRPLNEVRERR